MTEFERRIIKELQGIGKRAMQNTEMYGRGRRDRDSIRD